MQHDDMQQVVIGQTPLTYVDAMLLGHPMYPLPGDFCFGFIEIINSIVP